MFNLSTSCRICLSENKDDFESLLDNEQSNEELSDVGVLYQELFHMTVDKNEESPKYLCKYCLLQLKLFSEFRAKAVRSCEMFKKLISDDTNQEEEPSQVIQENPEIEIDENSAGNDVVEFKREENANDDDTSDGSEHFSDVQYLEDDVELLKEYCERWSVDIEEVIPMQQTDKIKDSGSNEMISIETFEVLNCKDCSETFIDKSSLYNHRRKEHKKTKLHCTVCNKTFLSEESLNVHMKSHFGLPAYKCDECGKTFKQKAHFRYHQMGHNNERNVQCHLCGKGFLSKSDLKIHFRVHNDERRYECDVCKKRFRAYTHMTNHRYQHFDEKLECDICLQKYSSPNTLRTHKKSIHSDVYPYVCDICPKKFKRKHHLINHKKIHLKNDELKMEEEFSEQEVQVS